MDEHISGNTVISIGIRKYQKSIRRFNDSLFSETLIMWGCYSVFILLATPDFLVRSNDAGAQPFEDSKQLWIYSIK